MRLVYCSHCETLEEIPDYELGEGEVDPYVEGIVFKHNERDPMAHGGARIKSSPMRIFVVDDEEWATKRDKVIEHINEMNKSAGMTSWVNEAHNTYLDDAMRCFRSHHRPTAGCIDYWDDSKRIGRPTPTGRKAVKENYKLGDADPHICAYCPVHTYVTTMARAKQGAYKELK